MRLHPGQSGRHPRVAVALLLVAGLAGCRSLAPAGPSPTPRWYRGNVHTHTLWSDGDSAPEAVVDWYAAHGYDFLVISDHNILPEGEFWRAIGVGYKLAHPSTRRAAGALRRRRGRGAPTRGGRGRNCGSRR